MKYFFIFYFILSTRILLSAQSNALEGKQSMTPNENQAIQHEPLMYPTATMLKVNPKKISEGLRATLGNVGYVGWEKGNLYLDKSTNEYALEFPASSLIDGKDKRESVNKNISPARWYFFTYEGKPFSMDQWQQ